MFVRRNNGIPNLLVMNIEALDWSVVIAGYWNQAILTPAGIAYRLFKKPKDTPVQVEIPLDGIAPYRVRDGSIIIMAQPKRLHIIAEPPCYENLKELANSISSINGATGNSDTSGRF
ncbi:MAG: hypothetical protein IPL83_08600 [Bdellovibrionales bacterium]|nr:hypothetical protein [Bdellovibrionales bacterium]